MELKQEYDYFNYLAREEDRINYVFLFTITFLTILIRRKKNNKYIKLQK